MTVLTISCWVDEFHERDDTVFLLCKENKKVAEY